MTTEEQKGQRMIALARSFPSMRLKIAADAIWNFPALVETSRQWSSGEKLIVSFLADVWNVHEAHEWVEPFNVVSASKRLSPDNWAAFVAWTSEPFFC